MANAAVFWLNPFQANGGISATLSPWMLITGQCIDYHQHCKDQFGEYTQTHEEHDNSMQPQTIGGLALRPTRNAQGNFYFLSLSRSLIINRTHATSLPMPKYVLYRCTRWPENRETTQDCCLQTGTRKRWTNMKWRMKTRMTAHIKSR